MSLVLPSETVLPAPSARKRGIVCSLPHLLLGLLSITASLPRGVLGQVCRGWGMLH